MIGSYGLRWKIEKVFLGRRNNPGSLRGGPTIAVTKLMKRMRMRSLYIRLALTFLCVFVFLPHALGQNELSLSPISEWTVHLNSIGGQLEDPTLTSEALLQLRNDLETIRREARAWVAAQAPKIEAARADLEALGPPPVADGEPEGADRAALRAELAARLAAIAQPVSEAELLMGRTSRAVAQIADIRRKRFTERLLSRSQSPISAITLKGAAQELASISDLIARSATAYVQSPQFRESLRGSAVTLLAAAVFALILVWPLKSFLLRRYGRYPSAAPPGFMRALRAAFVVGASRTFLPASAAALIFLALATSDLLSGPGTAIGLAVLAGFVLFTSTVGLTRAFLSPQQPDWRVVPVSTNLAVGLIGIVSGLAVVFAVDVVISVVITTYDARLVVTEFTDYAVTVAVTLLLLLLLLRHSIWMPDSASEKPQWRSLRVLTAIGLLLVPALGAFGYVALARLVVTQIVVTGGLIFLILALRRLGREVVAWTIASEMAAGEWLRTFLPKDDEGTSRLAFWLAVVFDLALIFLGVIAALFVWGADGRDVGDWAYRAVFGFKIGPITLSMVDLVVAIALFVGLFVATRFVQRMLTEKVLPQTQLDPGIRQSIGTATGYVGIVIAAAVGVSALGLDLSNLALVAGALSVGIGFGLQNVVNNFVSGLILLVERPVKVGDWVIVGGLEGHVRRINVRATEIQTFDRASVFVPNSQLISETVTNWTHGDKIGRVKIPVGVAYGSDTRLVGETLTRIAKAHLEVISFPKPAAVFMGFGDNSLNFELRCFLRDVNGIVEARSSLCFAIDDEFRTLGIKIPYPQRDVHMNPPPSRTDD